MEGSSGQRYETILSHHVYWQIYQQLDRTERVTTHKTLMPVLQYAFVQSAEVQAFLSDQHHGDK